MQPDRALAHTELCSRTRIDKVQVSRAIKRLLNMGNVDRIVDPKGRCRAYLMPTKPCQRVYGDVVPVTLAWERAFLSRLSRAETQTPDDMLTLLQTITDEMSLEKSCPRSEPRRSWEFRTKNRELVCPCCRRKLRDMAASIVIVTTGLFR